jgi:polysaccharide export outer membrane protein
MFRLTTQRPGRRLALFQIFRRALLLAALLIAAPSFSQVPIPLQEQIQRFNALPAAQQQALIRELQRQLPPAQRDAIISQLRQTGAAQGTANAAPETETSQMPGAAAQIQQAMDALEQREHPILAPGDTLVIEFSVPEPDPEAAAPPPLPPEEQERIEEMQARLADGNPYKLDSTGRLYLPGVPSMELAGLDVDQATVRIQAERLLKPFDVVVTYLPLQPTGTGALEPFGYDLFSNVPSTFAPATDIPVPADYVIGPGDTVNVQLFGNQNAEYFLAVSREGGINFPEIGPITVSGLTLTELRNTINQRVGEQMIGVRASTTLGELRSIRVFVLGDVAQPGSYTVSGLSTMTNALLAGGGVTKIGSLRNVQLRRDGQTVSTLDLYDLLLRGDTSGDARLQPGDVIFVPPIGPTVAIDGEVRRPAIYETKNEQSIADVIALAGGLNPDANRSAVKLERIVPGRGTTVRDIDMAAAPAAADVGIRDGDVIHVQPNLDQLESSVRLSGNVYRPGLYQWFSGMTLGDLLPTPELVKPMSDVNYVLIRRENEPNVQIEVLSTDLQAIWSRKSGTNNPALEPRDTVYVFNLDVGRQQIIEPIMEELQAQVPTNQPPPTVTVGGQVRAEGEYPLEPGMRVSDLLRAGGGMTASAYAKEAELTRYAVVNGESRETELVDVDLAAVLAGNRSADVLLAPYDYLNIKEVPRWREQQSVTVQGEVQFPGTYPIEQGEMLSSVLRRAGGLTDLAFPQGSVFTREDLREREAEQLKTLANRVESDLASVALADPNASDAISTGRTLVNQLRSTEAVGRLVIDLQDLVAGDEESDIVLKDGDELYVPQTTQEVMVLGEVQNSTSHLYSRRLDRDDYVAMSGGVTKRADKKRTYVVRANGEVVANTGAKWFQRSGSVDIEPGDAIVVPLDTDRVRPLTAWQSITQILYNIAIAVSVINKI